MGTGWRLPFSWAGPSGTTVARSPRSSRVVGPMTTSPGGAVAYSRAARLMVSPITVKLRWRSAPTLPTTAGPVFTAIRNRGQLE
jgi:hypothetical protein